MTDGGNSNEELLVGVSDSRGLFVSGVLNQVRLVMTHVLVVRVLQLFSH